MTWWKFRFPSEKDAFRFAVDRLEGHVTPPQDADPFGVHGKHVGNLIREKGLHFNQSCDKMLFEDEGK